jgi:hypothetical protein
MNAPYREAAPIPPKPKPGYTAVGLAARRMAKMNVFCACCWGFNTIIHGIQMITRHGSIGLHVSIIGLYVLLFSNYCWMARIKFREAERNREKV